MGDRRLWFTHKCCVCGMLFVSERDLLLHEASHKKPDLTCPVCGDIFDTAEQLAAHGCLAEAADGRTHVCRVCGDVFNAVRDLYDHHSERHMNGMRTQFECTTCGSKFSWRENLEKHEQLHRANSSVCRTCGAVFASLASLKVHLWKAHNLNTNEQEQQLIELPPTSTAAGGLGKRSSSAAAAISTAGSQWEKSRSYAAPGRRAQGSNDSEDKPFRCPMCNWSFKYDFSLTSHMKVHDNDQHIYDASRNANEPGTRGHADQNAKRHCGSSVSSLQATAMVAQARTAPHTRLMPRTDGILSTCEIIRKVKVVTNSDDKKSGKIEVDLTDRDVSLDIAEMDGFKKEDCLVGRGSTCEMGSMMGGYQQSHGRSNDRTPMKASYSAPAKPQTAAGENPFRCKICSATFKYDFSFMAHMNYHTKSKLLEGIDFQNPLKSLPEPLLVHEDLQMVTLAGAQLAECDMVMTSDGNIVDSNGTILISVEDMIAGQSDGEDGIEFEMFDLQTSPDNKFNYILVHPPASEGGDSADGSSTCQTTSFTCKQEEALGDDIGHSGSDDRRNIVTTCHDLSSERSPSAKSTGAASNEVSKFSGATVIPEKRFMCFFCKATFRWKKNLELHMRKNHVRSRDSCAAVTGVQSSLIHGSQSFLKSNQIP